ncbi:probable thiol methyltransferase 2 isoform X1 [Sesamum indicum]|uniref:Probable thiol methyltransferase 2 isoform X1 n=1 Tax=Sesamum indicum TaxID=4182 RepID=A0A6I9TUU6_SESIN|nr:probable thiol methyltransferase 2 isoform X1 [Sesamum indicum]
MPSSLLAQYYSPLRILTRFSPHSGMRFKNMTARKPNKVAHDSPSPITADETINMFQQVFHSQPTTINGWDKCWQQGLTPWDLGCPAPVLVHLNNTGSLPKGRALVPGCGSGYDVVAIASAERHVVGVDLSDNAIKRATELSSRSPNAEHFTFLKTDFFTWCPTQLFDLIFDYTFFCAIEPGLRSQWARKISDLLKPDGELITLMFPVDDHEGGPPYKVSVADYEEVLHPLGLKATYIAENELAVAPRMWGFQKQKLNRIEVSQHKDIWFMVVIRLHISANV